MAQHQPRAPISPVQIADRVVGPNQPTFLIAEIGTSHRGDLHRARELITAAAKAGADCVKSQYVIAEELVHPRMGRIALPGGETPLFERFRQVERPPEFYAAMRDETTSQGMVFLCAPFGVESARHLNGLGLAGFKVASPELNHTPMLRELGSFGRPLIVSTGVSHPSDIEYCLSLTGCPTVLLQCVTEYPAAPEDYNLRVLRPLQELFGCPVGVSDHTIEPAVVPVVAVLAGGCAVEKHLTLSKADGGLDDPIALDPDELAELVHRVRAAEAVRDVGGPDALLAHVEELVGRRRLERVLGSSRKRLVSGESQIYHTTNRSLMFAADLPAGTSLTGHNLAVLRAERNLTPGLHPRFLDTVLGARLIRDARSGDGLLWDDLLQR